MKTQVSENDLQDLLTNNETRITKNIEEVVSNAQPEQTILLAMDFDECATKQHFSRMVTKYYWERGFSDENALNDLSVKGIASLFNCYVGLTKDEFSHQVKTLARDLTWKEDFKEAFAKIVSNPHILPVFISSGVTEVAKEALQTLGFNNVAIIADDLGFRDNVIYGPATIVSDSLKGDIVRQIANLKQFNRVVTLGHSKGDVELIKAGSMGSKISFKDKDEAMQVADIVIESWTEVVTILS